MMRESIQNSEVGILKFRGRFFLVLIMATVFSRGVAGAGELPLAELDARFTAVETPVVMEYDVGYRLLNIELRRVGKIVATTTIGRWKHRVSGGEVPALFLDMRVNSPDSGRAGERGRVSIHDRIVVVMTIPDLEALVFAKYTDEYLHPLIGRCTESLLWSIYDTQSGRLEYENHDLRNGEVKTHLQNPEALLELSRKIRPVMEFLVKQCVAPSPDARNSDKARIVANIDGRVAALRILTERDKAPGCLDHRRVDAMLIRTVAESGSSVKPRDFRAWSLTFKQLSALLQNNALIQAADHAPVETVVPLAVDYELGLGSVRASMTSINLGATGQAARVDGRSRSGG